MTCQSVTLTGAAGTLWEVRISIYRLPWAGDFSESVLTSVANAANVVVEPLGYKFQEATFQWADDTHGVASLWYQETGTPAIAIPPIVASIVLILLAVGFFILSIAIYRWSGSDATLTDSKTHTNDDATDALTDAYKAGKITYEQYMAGIKALQDALKGTDWATVLLGLGALVGLSYMGGSYIKTRRSR